MNLKEFIRSIPDYPKKGILFRDITTLIKDEKAFAEIKNYYNDITHNNLDLIKSLKEEVADVRRREIQDEKAMETVRSPRFEVLRCLHFVAGTRI